MEKVVRWEWDIETSDADGDIEDHHHADRLRDLPKLKNPREVLVLVCDDWSSHDLDRSWAYVTDGKLPEKTEDADGRPVRRVPKSFHRELERVAQALARAAAEKTQVLAETAEE